MRSALALLACLGCSSHYMPRTHGRVAVIMADGKTAYVRDGVIYDHGVIGGGLARAVAGNPGAVAAANEYHDHIRDGLLEALGGAVAMIGGAGWVAVEAANSPDQRNPRISAAPIALAIGGAILMCVGGGTAVAAEPYRWDAINIFNDGPAPGQLEPPGWTTRVDAHANDSLHMR